MEKIPFNFPHVNSPRQPHEEGMLALCRVGREVLVVEVEYSLLHFEPERLVEHHSVVVGRDVEGDVFSLARLNEVVQHEFGDARPPPFRMREQERYVGLELIFVGHQECEAYDDLTVHGDDREIGILEAFRH